MARLRYGTDTLGKEILELISSPLGSAASNPHEPSSGQQDSIGEQEGGNFEENKPYKGENTIVMMEWEKPYMRALVDVLGITGAKLGERNGVGANRSVSNVRHPRRRGPQCVVGERGRGALTPGVFFLGRGEAKRRVQYCGCSTL